MKHRNGTAPPKRLHPWQRRRRKALLLAFIVLTPIAVFFVFRIRLNMENDRIIAALRAEGLPTTPEELAAWYPEVPEGENAAPLYLSAQKSKGRLLPAKEDLVPYTGHGPELQPYEAFSEETLAHMAEYVALNGEALSLLHQAAQKKQCRYPIDLTKGMATELPHLAGLRESGRMLCVESAWAAETGDDPRATRALLDILAMAESLRNEPILVSQLVRISLRLTASNLLERLLSRISLPEGALSPLDTALRESHDPEALPRALAGEQCMGLDAFQDPRSLGRNRGDFIDGPVGVAMRVIGMAEVDMQYFLRAYRILLDGAHKPFPAALATGKAVEDYMRNLHGILSIRTQMLVPALGRAATAFAREEATLREMETALAIERYRQRRGAPPDALEALVPDFMPAVPQDPFDGAPLRYRTVPEDPFDGSPLRYRGGVAEYTIYSVYENKIDDGGVRQPAGKKRQQPLDWVFRVVLPQ